MITVIKKVKFVIVLVLFLQLFVLSSNNYTKASTSENIVGIALKEPTKVYSSTSTNSTILKSYSKGTILKYISYNSSWYKATVYVSGKAKTGYIYGNDVENSATNQEEYRGLALKSSTAVYSKASTSASVLKTYSVGSILKFESFTSDWFEATVYVNGQKKTGYINKSHVEIVSNSQKDYRGIALNSPTKIYEKASTSSTILKSYTIGKILKYKSFSTNWYEATVYVNGKKRTGYIYKSSVENVVTEQQSLKGIALLNSTAVYTDASTTSSKLKTYAAGRILEYKTFTSNWYEATVYVNNQKRSGYIPKSSVDQLVSNYGKALTGRGLKSPTKVYSIPSTSSTALKSYSKGSMLSFKTLSTNWYEATVYVSGKKRTGYIHVNDLTTKDIITTTNYNITFSNFVDRQMAYGDPKADGAGKYSASRSAVEYYANPSNFPNGTPEYFQFLDLTASAGLSANEINTKLLTNAGVLANKGQAFVEAAKTNSINEVYLISHALHETSNGTSTLAKGIPVDSQGNVTRDKNGNITKTTETYKTVYNMYGYGAIDSDPIEGGAKYAFDNQWFTVDAAIIGGAKDIGTNYLKKGQNTLYKMKWNPANPGIHQYATHVQWATAQALKMYNFYQKLDNYILVYDIPKFINQPGKTTKPSSLIDSNSSQDTGSSNTDSSQVSSFPNNIYGVTNSDGSNLNLRSSASTSGSIITKIPDKSKIIIVGQHTNGWYKINYNGNTGYVSNEYVTVLNLIQVTVDGLRIRTEASTNGNTVGTVSSGQYVAGVLDNNNKLITSNEWYQIYYNNAKYWISSGEENDPYLKVIN
ncbi:SH3 domain-containing protein [Ureibacillus sp. 179-F W5.1 NHS]|uniref:SH3 domain-containing protein n=1 Tax=Ureibacillus sp. 179-F W5.1 NHS TaxID=3374297 RepID=UPI003879383B